MKLEVGMYVRSKINGRIGKITDIEETKVFDRYLTVIREEIRYILDNNSNIGFCETEKDSVITSHNIIDLIEKGDYVNGRKVLSIHCDDGFDLYLVLDGGGSCDGMPLNQDIKSIVTKEQFESMSYKVGE